MLPRNPCASLTGVLTMTRRTFAVTAIAIASSLYAGSVCAQVAEPVATVRVDATPGHAINSFDPDAALGSTIDALSHFGIDKVYTPHITQESLCRLGPDQLSK